MTPKEIILLFVDCALELSEKGFSPNLYYQDNANLIEIFIISPDNAHPKCSIYLDRERPFTKEEVSKRLDAFKSTLS